MIHDYYPLTIPLIMYHNIRKLLFQIILFNLFATSICYEYCSYQKELCGAHSRHIACVDLPHYVEQKMTLVCPMTDKIHELILKKHNAIRNKTACGDYIYPFASKMKELKWDYELEYLAELHNKMCLKGEDECRNTCRFRSVAQLTVQIDHSDNDTIKIITQILKSWIDNIQYIETSVNETGVFVKDDTDKDNLMIISDSVNFIGCSFAKCVIHEKPAQVFTCNYSNNLLPGDLLYEKGAPQTKCIKKKIISHGYNSCLCVNRGVVFTE